MNYSQAQVSKLHYMLLKFALFLILFLDGLGQSLIFPILAHTLLIPENVSLVQQATLHDRQVLYGIIIGLFYFCWMLGTAILGDLSDSYGRKKGLMICSMGMVVGNLLTVLAFAYSRVWLIIIGRVVIGFTAGSQAIAQASIVDLGGVTNQARNTGRIILAVTLGGICGPIYGQIFSDNQISFLFNSQTPFIGVTLLPLFSMVILLFFYHDVARPNYQPIKLTRILYIFKEAFNYSQIRVLLISMFGIFSCWSIYYTYMTVYLVKVLNASSFNISIFMSMYGIGASIAMAILGSLIEKKFSIKQAVVGGWSLLALASLLTELSPWLSLDFGLAVFAGIGVGVGMLFTMKAFSVQVAMDRQGWIMGIFNASWVGIMGISIMVTGYIANLSIALPLVVGYLLFLFGIMLFINKVKIS